MGQGRRRLYNSPVPKTKPKNPFFILLMIVGTVFALTACGYGAMAVRMSRTDQLTPGDRFFDAYGMWIMLGELAALTILTFAAILTDDYWTGVGEQRNSEE